MAEENATPTNGTPDQSVNNDADEKDEDVGVDWTGELVEKTFTLKVPVGFDNLLKHHGAFGYRGEKGKDKDGKRVLHKFDIQFTTIKAMIDCAINNVKDRRLRRIDSWPISGVPLVNEEGQFIQQQKTLDEMINETAPEELLARLGPEMLAKLFAAHQAQQAMYQQKILAEGQEHSDGKANGTAGVSNDQLKDAANKAAAKKATAKKATK